MRKVIKPKIRNLPRNVWVVSLTSFLNDISSEMILNVLPLYLAYVIGIRTNIIGIIEGLAESTSSLLKVFSGWISDQLQGRKWPAVAGYAISTLSKPIFYFAGSWEVIGTARWADRIGKGIRTAPRDALIADTIDGKHRGLAFGFHRAADTGGAMIGILIALGVVLFSQSNLQLIEEVTFRRLVLISLIPAVLAVLVLAFGVSEVSTIKKREMPGFALKPLGTRFILFLVVVGLFDLGNSSDAFLILRAQERGVSLSGVLGILAVFNLVYALVSTPAGSLSDRLGRKEVLVGGWMIYTFIYIGFGLANRVWQIWFFYILYGVYYGLAYGTAKAFVADLVPVNLRGTAYGTYNATLGIINFPASAIAGVLWHGVGRWDGFGPSAPFLFGAGMSLMAVILLLLLPQFRDR